MTTERAVLDGIKQRLASITPGPWDVDAGDGTIYAITDDPPLLFVPHEDHCHYKTGEPSEDCMSDAVFIAAAPVDVARLTRAVEEALSWAEKFETNQSSDIAKRQDAQFDLGYSAGRRAAGNILRAAIENALNS